MVKVRGRNSNGKTVKQTAENWHVRGFVTSWCHTGATSQSWQGHTTESGYSWSAGISPRQVMTWCWHDDDCDRHLAHHRDAVQSRCFEPRPDVTGNFRNFLVLVCRLLVGKFRSWTAPMVCSRQSIGWGGLWRSCCPSCQIFGAVRFEPKRSFLDSPRERRCPCAVDFWHTVVKPWRRKTTRTYYRFWKSRWNNELRSIGFGWLRSPTSINQESEDNIELLPLYLYLASHSVHVLCHCLVKQHSRNDKKKKKKKKKDCQMSVCRKADLGELIQWVTPESRSSAASNSGLIRIGTQPRTADAWHHDSCRPRSVVTRDFSAMIDSLFDRLPVRISTSDLHHWILRKKSFISELMILECSFPLSIPGLECTVKRSKLWKLIAYETPKSSIY